MGLFLLGEFDYIASTCYSLCSLHSLALTLLSPPRPLVSDLLIRAPPLSGSIIGNVRFLPLSLSLSY